MLGHELRELLKKELPSELDLATFLANKIVALGGEVRIRPTMPAGIGAARELLQQHRLRTQNHKQLRETHRSGGGVWR
jgi:hypothetical protein